MNRLPRLAFIAAVLLLPLAVAACGVKGPLEPPARAGISPTGGQERSAAERQERIAEGGWSDDRGLGASSVEPVGATTGAAVTEAPAARRGSMLDWLIN